METFGLSNAEIKTIGDGYFIERDHAYYYVPKNCTDTTNTIVYAHGAGGSNLNYYMSYLKEQPVDAIFIIPKDRLSYNNMNESMDYISKDLLKIQNNLGITNSNMFTIGHSSGGKASMYFMIENIKNNPDIGPQTCVLIDPATADTTNAGFIQSLTEKQLKVIGDNQSTIIALEHSGADASASLANYQRLGRAGANVVVMGFRDVANLSGSEGSAHVGIAINAFNKGILSYLAGDIPIEKVIDKKVAVIYQYDRKSGNFKEVSASSITGYVGSVLGSFSNFNLNTGEYYSKVDFNDFNKQSIRLLSLGNIEMISNDQGYVAGEMNGIRSIIRSTNLVSNIKNIGCKSTTAVPTCAENFLHDYFSAILTLLDKLSVETEKAVNIGYAIDEADKELERAAQDIPKTIYVTVPATGTISSSNVTSKANSPITPMGTITNVNPIRTNTNSSKDYYNKQKVLKSYDINTMLSKNIDTKLYDVTADDLNRLFEHWADITGNYDSPLLGTGESWIKACDETGLDPLTLIGICGEETGRGGFKAMDWMNQKNFIGMRYIDPSGDGTGSSILWGDTNDVFGGDVDAAILASAKRVKNFYGGMYGGNTIKSLAHTGYTGNSDSKGYANVNDNFAYMWASIMKESLDYITSTNGGV